MLSKYSNLVKPSVVVLMILLLGLPLGAIEGIIYERKNFRHEAATSIQKSWTGRQLVAGPILVVPYEIEETYDVYDSRIRANQIKKRKEIRNIALNPGTLEVHSVVDTEYRYKGLYRIPVYKATVSVKGTFSAEQINEIKKASGFVRFKTPQLKVLVSDNRGILGQPTLVWDNQAVQLSPGSGITGHQNGMHAALPQNTLDSQTGWSFSYQLKLKGMKSLLFSPTGEYNKVRIDSAWPHPEFVGRFLPDDREVSEQGFNAMWQTSAFSSNTAEKALGCINGKCDALFKEHLGVEFLEPVDLYRVAERSVKYGMLFIGMNFLVFLLLELVGRYRIHPVQYGLVGLSLSVFYLLFLSLTEHTSLLVSYVTAAAACSMLSSFYVAYMIDSRLRTAVYGLFLMIMYTMLFVIIQSEDYALLLGSLVVFTSIGSFMILTRNVDWYKLGDDLSEPDSWTPDEDEPLRPEA